MTVAWSLVLNVSILAAVLRQDKIALIMHLVGGWAIFVTTYVMILQLLIPLGFNVQLKGTWQMYAHGIVGVMLLGFVVIQVVGGMICRLLPKGKSIEINKLKFLRRGHHFMGYFLAIIYKGVNLWAWNIGETFYSLLAWELLWFSIFFAVKFGRSKMEKKIIDEQTQDFICPQIGHSRDISRVTESYFIFANYVYDARGLD